MAPSCARLLCVAALWSLTDATPVRAGTPPPHANLPLPPTLFTIDAFSPSLGGSGMIDPDDILRKPGPSVVFPAPGLGLGQPGVDVNGISANRRSATMGTFVLLFSVGRQAIGAVPPDPVVVSMGFPYNVQHQGDSTRRQAAGDLYMTTRLFNQAGPVGSLRLAANNVGVINQGDAGGVDYDLDPPDSPDVTEPFGTPLDEVNGVAYLPGDAGLADDRGGSPPSPRAGVGIELFFSVTQNSPAPNFVPPQNRGATVFLDFNVFGPGSEVVYAQPAQLGLQPLDDIDALVVLDAAGNGVFNPGVDFILFSLTATSPTVVNLGVSPGAVLISAGLGFQIYAAPTDLGLLHSDELDALEVFPSADEVQTIIDRAIFRAPNYVTCAGDLNGDLKVDGDDVQLFVNCVLAGPPMWPQCQSAEFVIDGDITPADVPGFVDRLLTSLGC